MNYGIKALAGLWLNMIYLLRSQPTQEQVDEMLQMLGSYIKLAVDIRRGVLTGGGAMHADCEKVLLEDGSHQEDIWGADWVPSTQEVRYEALINIRPRQNNSAMEILDPTVRKRVAEITTRIFKHT